MSLLLEGAKIPPTIGLFVVLDGVVQASVCTMDADQVNSASHMYGHLMSSM